MPKREGRTNCMQKGKEWMTDDLEVSILCWLQFKPVLMKINIKNLKGEMFSVEAEPAQTVPKSASRLQSSSKSSNSRRATPLMIKKSFSRAKPSLMTTPSNNQPLKKKIVSSSWSKQQQSGLYTETCHQASPKGRTKEGRAQEGVTQKRRSEKGRCRRGFFYSRQ